MPVNVTVLYPNVDGSEFKLDYYLKSHMPLVAEKFASHGMTGWRVVKLEKTPDGGKPQYSIQATLEFGDAGQVASALEKEGPVVLGDIPNFSNQNPTIMIGEVVGKSG